MSFNAYMVGIVTFMALLIPFISVYCFMRGYALGVKDWNRSHPDDPKIEPEHKIKHVATVTDTRLQELRDILENIENYDGTEAHQKEIH